MDREALGISVIVPVYQVSAYVERCIRSVMDQTFACRECIIVDDASPDDSIAICERLIAAYYVPGFCFHYYIHSSRRGLDRILPAFRQALSDGHHRGAKFILNSTVLLSRNAVGRGMISLALKTRRFIRSLYAS